jgi:hypothetical protein
MTIIDAPQFGAPDVIQLASKFAKDDAAFVIGGQATNLWAWYYADRDPSLHLNGPFTSEDIDYFGSLAVATSFAKATNGELETPNRDDATPNTAIVRTVVNGKPVQIDFLHGVLGIKQRELQKGVTELSVAAQIEGKPAQALIKVIHPIICLKCRVANILSPALKRSDEISKRQLKAAVAILGCYIDEALDDPAEGWSDAKACFSDLFAYLRSDEYGRVADNKLDVDPLEILKRFEDDARIDARYREKQLKKFIAVVEKRRASRSTRFAARLKAEAVSSR